MGFPSSPDTRIRSRNDAASVGALLKERHAGHFMVWNLSEESYGEWWSHHASAGTYSGVVVC